jgi:flagellin
MNELAVKAANGTNQSEDQSYIQSEVDALISEIDRVSQTTTFNEKSLLDGSWSTGVNLQVGTEGTSGNRISVSINAMSAGGIGISSLSTSGVKSESAAQNAISTIKAAISSVSKQRSDLGAIQNRLEHTINNLDNVAENTTSAESAIRDTDMATEMVKYSNANILAQAGQAMLAQANQSNQGVLSLLG